MKRLGMVLLVLLLVIAMCPAVFAASITISSQPPEAGSSGGEVYTAYKVFDVYQLGDKTIYTIEGSSPFYEAVSGSPLFELNETGTAGEYEVLFKGDEGDSAEIAALLDGVAAKGTAAGSATADGTGTAVIADLDPGYYLVTGSFGSSIIIGVLGDEAIESKTVYPSLTKQADKETACFGETVTYTITVSVPSAATEAITVHDSMQGLDYGALTADSFEVTADTSAADGHTVDFVISPAQVAANAGESITIKYTATVGADSIVGENDAFLTYSSFTGTPVETEVRNHKADVFKYTGAEKTGLAGAGFVIKNEAGDFYKLTDGIVTWVSDEGDATELTTEADAFTVSFIGLADGTYTLVEKTVPTGYNRANDTPFTINGADLSGDAQIEVENNSGSELPSTGGMGTTLFYVVGGLLILGAAMLLIARKRRA